MTTPHPGPDVAALRAAVARIEAGGSPHRPPRPPSDPTQSGGGHLGRSPAGSGPAAADAEGGAARDPHAIAREIVLRQLTNSPKTRSQLRAKLAERGCDQQVAEEVLDRLSDVGLVDDAAYAETYVRSQQLTRGRSRRALAHDLQQKGVTEDIVADAVGGIEDAHEAERARELVRARLPRLAGLGRDVTLRRLAGMLARKGYPSGLATRIVLEEVDTAAEHRRD